MVTEPVRHEYDASAKIVPMVGTSYEKCEAVQTIAVTVMATTAESPTGTSSGWEMVRPVVRAHADARSRTRAGGVIVWS